MITIPLQVKRQKNNPSCGTTNKKDLIFTGNPHIFTTPMMQYPAPPYRFLVTFILLFLMFYGFHLCIIGITSPGRLYSSFIDQHFNYIKTWRQLSISATANILKMMGYTVYTTETTLKVDGLAGFKLVYSCLGYGIMSCFASFVLSFPKPWLSKITFLGLGLTTIQLLNIARFILISIYYKPQAIILQVNHHDLFNYTLYSILLLIVYVWLQLSQTKRRNQQQVY